MFRNLTIRVQFLSLSTRFCRSSSLSVKGGETIPCPGCHFFSRSAILAAESQSQQHPPNSSIEPKHVNNRNPRNLEKLRIADKPLGWHLERESRTFWNKVTLEISSQHISASVAHFLGQKPVNVSTKEWCIKKFLYNTNDASAAKLVGQVLAQRCLQVGITEVACFFPEEQRKKEKVSLFLEAVEGGGVALSEASQVQLDWNIGHWELPETPWNVHEDINDTYSDAATMRGYVERLRNPRNTSPYPVKSGKVIKKKFGA